MNRLSHTLAFIALHPVQRQKETYRETTPRDENSLRQKCKRLDMDYHLVVNRIRLGWTEAQALRVPKLKRGAQFGHK